MFFRHLFFFFFAAVFEPKRKARIVFEWITGKGYSLHILIITGPITIHSTLKIIQP